MKYRKKKKRVLSYERKLDNIGSTKLNFLTFELKATAFTEAMKK